MASLSAIRTALKNTIENYTAEDIYCYDTVSGVGHMPAAVIIPTDKPMTADFEGAFARGMDTWFFDIYVLTPVSDAEAGQNLLDELITGAGENSIREAIYKHADLGLTDSTVDAQVFSVKDYGGKFEWANIKHQGACLKVRVHTDGRK